MTTTQHSLRRGPSPIGSRPVSLGVGRLLGVVALVAALPGCPSPDAQGKFDRFNDQTEDDRPKLDVPEPDLPPIEVFPDLNGTYLVAIETSIAAGLPLQFVADVQADVDLATGDGSLSISFQPLSLDVGSTTEPREEVGDAIVVDAAMMGGQFVIPFGETDVTGQANPITGSDITADLSLQGNVRGDTWCGAVTGNVLSPIQAPLDGSTFAALRLADRGERPETFPVKCDDIVVEEGETEGMGSDGGATTGETTGGLGG